MAENEIIKISGIVDTVVYRNVNNGYSIIELDMGDVLTTVVGEIGNVEEGEELELSGEYVTNAKYGVQFKASLCERKLPETAYAIQKYLGSGAIKGIGPALAKSIVEEFGERSLEVIENSPELLVKVKGITAKKVDKISSEFQRIFGIRKLMNHLAQYEVSPSVAISAWKKWGQFSIDIINENPYSLCSYGVGLDFQKADEIADRLEIPFNDRNRIVAGIDYILYENAGDGHTCLPTDALQEKACAYLEISEEDFYKALEYQYEEENLFEYIKKGRSFTYLRDYYLAESHIAERLQVAGDFLLDTEYNYDDLITLEEECNGIKYESLQRKAISLALSQGFLILTGGPGTGKTTTLNAIISLYQQRGMEVMIAAPTGRAAKRISDLTGYDAKTIHRLLEVEYGENGNLKFVHDGDNPIDCDVIIIDEMSMVDTLLFSSLLAALKNTCRIILVGDSDQLPSVGAGNILKDLIDSKAMPTVALTEIFRQARESGIVTNAHAIVSGEMPNLDNTSKDFFFIQRLEQEQAMNTVVELYKTRLPRAYGYNSVEDIQIISPARNGIMNIVDINKRIQNEINPQKNGMDELKGKVYSFRVNDKVMQTRNNYDILWEKDGEHGKGIFNGDIGIIREIRRRDGIAVIDFEGRIAAYSVEILEHLELAYAITVHKSQGSEFPAVILVLVGGSEKLYYRNLFYTAVTRARNFLVTVGSVTNIERMVENNRRTRRYSCLKDMLSKRDDDE